MGKSQLASTQTCELCLLVASLYPLHMASLQERLQALDLRGLYRRRLDAIPDDFAYKAALIGWWEQHAAWEQGLEGCVNVPRPFKPKAMQKKIKSYRVESDEAHADALTAWEPAEAYWLEDVHSKERRRYDNSNWKRSSREAMTPQKRESEKEANAKAKKKARLAWTPEQRQAAKQYVQVLCSAPLCCPSVCVCAQWAHYVRNRVALAGSTVCGPPPI
jgi:hypothetical protein